MRPYLLLLLSCVALLTGCAELGSSRVGLSTRDLDQLRSAAEPPARHGIAIETSIGGALRIRDAYRMDSDLQTTIPLVRHPESGSRNPVIPIHINGRPLTASVDTGASFSMVTRDAAILAAVPALGPELIRLPTMTFSGAQYPVLAIAGTLQLGNLTIGEVPLGVLRRLPGMPELAEESLAEVDVILGQDLLRQFGLVVFDGPGHQLELAGRTSGATLSPQRVIDRVPWTRGAGGIPQFQARISGRGPVPVVFDSGGGFGLWIAEDTAKALGLADAGIPVELAVARSVFKPSTSRPARPSSLTAGAFVADALPTVIGMIRGGDHNPRFALLGNHILRTTAIAIDYRDPSILFLRRDR